MVYLDNGATTQKPRQVVNAITDEYYSVNANVHRGVHFLSQQATELHEASRETVRRFINARSTNEIVFTRGTTESINLLVSSFGEEFMQEGDEVILSVMEHHSNIVPWQLLAAKRGITIKVIPMMTRANSYWTNIGSCSPNVPGLSVWRMFPMCWVRSIPSRR